MKLSRGSKIIAALLLLTLAGGAFLAVQKKSAPGEKLGVVTRQNLVQRVTIAGDITSKRRTLVNAPYNGYVRKIFVRVGDKVKPGQPLVSVAQSLQSNEPVFPLRAPYEGTVMHVQRHEGEYVKEADGQDFILRIDDLSQLFVQANAPEVDRVKLKAGLEAVIKASAVPGRPYKGRITELTLAPRIDGKNGMGNSNKGGEYPVRIEVLDPDSQIGPGMSTVVDIITLKQDNVLTLRHEYVLREETGYFVFLLSGEKRKVETGLQNDEMIEIRSGLQENEQVKQIDFAALPENINP